MKKEKEKKKQDEELRKLQERYADRKDLEEKWKNRLSEPPEDRMIDPRKKKGAGVVTR